MGSIIQTGIQPIKVYHHHRSLQGRTIHLLVLRITTLISHVLMSCKKMAKISRNISAHLACFRTPQRAILPRQWKARPGCYSTQRLVRTHRARHAMWPLIQGQDKWWRRAHSQPKLMRVGSVIPCQPSPRRRLSHPIVQRHHWVISMELTVHITQPSVYKFRAEKRGTVLARTRILTSTTSSASFKTGIVADAGDEIVES